MQKRTWPLKANATRSAMSPPAGKAPEVFMVLYQWGLPLQGLGLAPGGACAKPVCVSTSFKSQQPVPGPMQGLYQGPGRFTISDTKVVADCCAAHIQARTPYHKSPQIILFYLDLTKAGIA